MSALEHSWQGESWTRTLPSPSSKKLGRTKSIRSAYDWEVEENTTPPVFALTTFSVTARHRDLVCRPTTLMLS